MSGDSPPPREFPSSPALPAAREASLAASLFTAVATVTGNLFLVVGTFVLAIITMLVAWVPPRTSWSYIVSKLWARGVLKASGVRLEVAVDPAVDPAASYVLVSNHQSLFDIPVLLASSPGNMRLMAKRSLFQIPVFGWSLYLAGFVPVDRQDKSSARGSFSSATGQLARGISILVFPEGTRSKTGQLLPFQRGGFLIALKSGLPLVPVGIRGTLAVQAGGKFGIHPGTAEVRYGAPIAVADYGVRRKTELIAEARRRIAELAGLPPEEPAAQPASESEALA